ncbi:hypothetical protein B5G34_16230 [Flavonifractor sp. An82]|nr:hypothetical protein B5G34_16230 [Flavonifractor sp. An82]
MAAIFPRAKACLQSCGPLEKWWFYPLEVCHVANELSQLTVLLKNLDDETRVRMGSVGNYHAPVAWLHHSAGLYVSVVNSILVHYYRNNNLRWTQTDKNDAGQLRSRPLAYTAEILYQRRKSDLS